MGTAPNFEFKAFAFRFSSDSPNFYILSSNFYLLLFNLLSSAFFFYLLYPNFFPANSSLFRLYYKKGN